MNTFLRTGLIVLVLAPSANFAGEIREFDLKTIERLGRDLSRQDAIAARASDLLLAKHPELEKGPFLEWVTDLSNGGSVCWIIDTEPRPTPAYKVVGDRIEDIRGKSLPSAVQARYNARRNAMKAVLPKLNAAYGAKYNFEVLKDPDGSGFLVYALAAFTRTDAIYIGGHFRITVSADGSKVERIDDLSRGIIENKASPGSQAMALGTAQAVDTKYPVETFIYSSNLYHIPIGVGTRDGTIWMVANGKIQNMGHKADSGKTRPLAKRNDHPSLSRLFNHRSFRRPQDRQRKSASLTSKPSSGLVKRV